MKNALSRLLKPVTPRINGSLVDEKLKDSLWLKRFIFQCFLAGLSIGIFMLFLDVMKFPVIVASVGATAHILFVTPNSRLATPRRTVGGHLVGIICGFIFSFIGNIEVAALLAVSFSCFIMASLNFEHPPAAGTALGLVINELTGHMVINVIVGVLVIVGIKHALRRYLRDLL